jgi:DNA-binding transcriptional LysR family regulator
MDVAAARTFIEIVKSGSFVNAAAGLNLTQTAVSARIRVLEDQLGRTLFLRNKSGARLTPAGERFLRFATTMVQSWEQARRAVALPEGKDMMVMLGAQLSLWNPLITRWMRWMRRECPQYALHAQVAGAEELMDQVQDGSLDAAVLYAAPRRVGVTAELLFEEKLVLVRTALVRPDSDLVEHIRIDWGPEFAERHAAAFPDQLTSIISVNHGPLALEYMLEAGGSGYFRQGFVRPWLDSSQLELVPNAPEFSYSAYVVYSSKADGGIVAQIRSGLRGAAADIF